MGEWEKGMLAEAGEMAAPAVAAGASSADTKPAGAPVAAAPVTPQPAARATATKPQDPFLRAENEDDDGYDPYSDRRPMPEPLFERDPWA